jgi:dissimilatory sulfite reductase (desulfoviridin) alpha/beta subunit
MEIDAGALKQLGFFQQADKGSFAVRLLVTGGVAEAGLLKKAAELAERYGSGKVHITSRQQIEIPSVPAGRIEALQKEMAEAGIAASPGGARVRTVAACPGAPFCKFAQIETGTLAGELQRRFGGRELPSKLKIALTGCPNDCLKVETNDIGIKGHKKSHLLFFGGNFGRQPRMGRALLPELESREAVIRVIGAALEFYASRAEKGERLGVFLERAGTEEFVRFLE